MGNIKTILKQGCLWPVAFVLTGFAGYIVWAQVVSPRIAAQGDCDRSAGCLYTAVNGRRSVAVIGFSADGSRFLSRGTSSGQIHDATNGKFLTALDEGRENYSYSISGDRSEIVAHRKDSVKVFDWNGELLRSWTPDPGTSVRHVVTIPLVKGFLVAEPAGVSVRQGDGALITWLVEGEGIMQVAAAEAGDYVAAYNFADDQLMAWPLQSLDDGIVIDEVEALAFQLSADGSRLAAGGPQGAYVWQTGDGSPVLAVEPEVLKTTTAVLSLDGSLLAVGFENGSVAVFDVNTRELIRRFDHDRPPNQIMFDPLATSLAVGLDSQTSVSGGELVFRTQPHHDNVPYLRDSEGMSPGGMLRQSQNRTSVKPGYAIVWSLAADEDEDQEEDGEG